MAALSKLRFYGVNRKIVMLFYKAVLESIVTVWFGNLTIQHKLVLTALNTVGHEEYLICFLNQVEKIVGD